MHDEIAPNSLDFIENQTAIEAFLVEPYPDGHRIRVSLILSPFQLPPNAQITITDHQNQEVASVNLVSIFNAENEITIHLPEGRSYTGPLKAQADVYLVEESEIMENGETKYTLSQSIIDKKSTTFSIP